MTAQSTVFCPATFRMVSALLLAFALPFAAPAVPQSSDPATEFLPVANRYLQALSEGRFEDALSLVDFRGMSDYLINRRIAELRQANPDMTPEEETQLIASFRENEVSNERLRKVALEMIEEQAPEGMTWTFKKTATSEKTKNGILLTYEMKKEGQPPKMLPLGLQKIGPAWQVAPHLMEQMLAPVKAETIEPPESAVRFGDRFWEHWRNGEMVEAYETFGPVLQKQIPLLAYLETTRKVIDDFGILLKWKLAAAYKLPRQQIGLAYDLEFVKKPGRAMLTLQEEADGWLVTGFQFMKSADAAAPASAPKPPPIEPAAPLEPVEVE